MGIFIKDIDMPKDCMGCPCRHDVELNYSGSIVESYCPIIKDMPDIPNTVENKLHDCPIIELPKKHGRLIDADELIQKLRNYHPTITFMDKTYNLRAVINDVEEIISKLQTIIEAEEPNGR